MSAGRGAATDRIRGQRSALLVVALSLAAMLGIPSLAAAASDEGTSKEEVAASMQEASAAIEELMERRRTPEARAERERSEHAHEDQSTDEALALARSRFRGAVLAPVWSPLGRPGGDVERFLGDRSALVEMPDGDRVAMESVVPLRPKTGPDRDELADLDLQRDGGELVPENPLVPIEISNQRDGGIEFPEAGVSVAVDTPGEAPAPEVVADKAFYANAGKDLDVLVAPTPAGAEVSLQIRSADAPERVALPFDLPPGARLGLSPASDPKTPSAAEIVKDGKTVGTISAPVAFDAEGVPLDVSYELEGEKLIVVFPHRDQDVLYPALVDPNLSFSDHYYQVNGQVDMWPWTFGQYGGAFGASGTNGLSLWTGAGTYPHASAAQWAYPAQRASYVVGVDYNNTWHAPSGHYPQGSCVNQGVWSPQRNWFEPGYWSSASGQSGSSPWSGGSGTATNTNACWTLYNDARWHRVNDGQSTYGNIALFKLTMNGAGPRPYPARAAISDIRVYLDDNNVPQITSNTGAPSGWVGGEVSITQAVGARDPGIGMAALKLTVPQAGGDPLGPVSWAVCTKGRLAGCPETLAASFTYDTSDMPEGVNAVTATPYDATWKTSTQVGQVKVDRSGPELELTGPARELTTDTGEVLSNDVLDLWIDAYDGDDQNPRSGVASIDVKVDGVLKTHYVDEEPCNEDSCDLDLNWDFNPADYSPGDHTIEVVATDKAGNLSKQSWSVTVSGDGEDANPDEAAEDQAEESRDAGTVIIPSSVPRQGSGAGCEVFLPEVSSGLFDLLQLLVTNARETTVFMADGTYRVSRCDSQGRLQVSQLVGLVPVPGETTARLVMESAVASPDGRTTIATPEFEEDPEDPDFVADWAAHGAAAQSEVIPPTTAP